MFTLNKKTMIKVTDLTDEEMILFAAALLEREGVRTKLGFELVGYNYKIGSAYAALLPYSRDQLGYIMAKEMADVYIRQLQKGINHALTPSDLSGYVLMKDQSRVIKSSVVNMLQKVAHYRKSTLGTDRTIPKQYIEFIEYLAAGYTVQEAGGYCKMTKTQANTGIKFICRATGARSVQDIIRIYSKVKDTIVTDLPEEKLDE